MGISNKLFSWCFRKFIGWIEGRACRKACLIVGMSEVDNSRLQALYELPTSKLFAFPQPIIQSKSSAEVKSISLRSSLSLPEDCLLIVFHGSWQHLPNREAIELLRSSVVPEVRKKFPNCYFVVAGGDVPNFSDDGIRSLGFVADLPTMLAECDIAALPILSGSGVRMKLFDYLQAGLPCVSTRKGMEGLTLRDGVEILISEDNAKDFSNKLQYLILDDELRITLRTNSTQYLNVEHDSKRVCQALAAKLELQCANQ